MLCNELDTPLKVPLPVWASTLHLIHAWFLGSTRHSIPNGTSIDSAVFAGLKIVTDRHTDHATRSITIGRAYVRSTATRPNNNTIIAKDVLPNIHRMQAAVSVCCRHPDTPRLRRNGIVCCCVQRTAYGARLTMHCQWG